MGLSAPMNRHLTVILTLAAVLATGPALAAVVKSDNDPREYASFILPNSMKVLVISDPRADKSAAALDVGVGSGADPKDRQGLAHFLEHMLFLGTEKYPTSGEYQQFISSHGGSHNAYTAYEHTNYYFDVDKDFLEPALDRFAQFFVAPLFTPKYVARERQVVHSEYQSKFKDDGWRRLDAQKRVTNPRHPFSQFSVGSVETLADREGRTVREDLVAFYRRHYSANLMTLVVLGKEPAPVLRGWVESMFSKVENRRAPLPRVEQPLFAQGTLPRRLDITPTKETRSLILTFPVPPLHPHYRSKPDYYVGALLGHEGKGSLLSALKQKGWAQRLSAGASNSNRDESTFDVSIRLTKAGLDHVDEIVSHVFQTLRLIAERGIRRSLFEEHGTIARLDFRFQERIDASGYVRGLAHSLHVYPAEDVLRGPYATDDYEPGLVRRFLSRLTPDNVLVTVAAQGLPTPSTTRWFKTPYGTEAIEEQTLERWRNAPVDPALEIPSPNVFLTEDIALKAADSTQAKPVLARKIDGLELWFKPDGTFRVPKADFFFSVRSEVANDSPTHAVLTELYVGLVNDQLNEFSYPAQVAGLGYQLYKHVRGFSVRISGYNDKQPLLLEHVTRALRHPKILPERFDVVKETLGRGLRNVRHGRPFVQAMSEVSNLLMRPYWSEEEQLAALEALNPSDLEAFVPKLLERVHLVALAHGNVRRDDAERLLSVVETTLLKDATPVTVPGARVVRLDQGDHYVRELDVDHADSSVAAYFQSADRSQESRAKFALASQIIASPFYQSLRTEQQLGYIVFATLLPLLDVPGLCFVVQSPSADPAELESHIETFLDGLETMMTDMDEEEFQTHKQSLVAEILKAEDNLQERSGRYWLEIDRKYYTFDSRERMAEALGGISKADMSSFFRQVLETERRSVTVRTAGSHHGEGFAKKRLTPAGTLVRDPARFGSGKRFFRG